VLPDASTGQDPGTLTKKLSGSAPREQCEQLGCTVLFEGRCACPGAFTIKKLPWVQEQKQKV